MTTQNIVKTGKTGLTNQFDGSSKTIKHHSDVKSPLHYHHGLRRPDRIFPFSSSLTEKGKRLFQVSSALNGTHGEATDSDDVNAPKKGKKTNKKQPKPAVKTVTKVISRTAKVITDLQRYELAQLDPFNPEASEARVPDMNSAPTCTFKAHGTATLTTNSFGVCSVSLSANPIFTLIDMTANSVTVANTSMSQMTANSPNVFSAVAPGNLSENLANCRVVASGFRLKNLQPPTTCTGRWIVATVPTNGDVPDLSTAQNIGVVNNAMFFRQTGIVVGTIGTQTNAGIPSTILEYPDGSEVTAQEIIATTVQCLPKPCDQKAFDFHLTQNISLISGTTLDYTNVGVNGSGVVVSGGIEDVTNYRGFTNILVRGEGLPINSIVAELEYIFHLEGTPGVPTSIVGMLVPATCKAHIDIVGFNKTVSKALNVQPFSMISDMMEGSYFSAAKKGFKMIAGKKATRNINQNILAKIGMSI